MVAFDLLDVSKLDVNDCEISHNKKQTKSSILNHTTLLSKAETELNIHQGYIFIIYYNTICLQLKGGGLC